MIIFLAFLALLASHPASAEIKTYTLSTNQQDHVLADGWTMLSFRSIYKKNAGDTRRDTAENHDLYRTVEGIPYVRVDETWLELINETKIYQHGYSFVIRNMGCKLRLQSPHGFKILDSCQIEVDTKVEPAPQMTTGPFRAVPFKIRKRWQSLSTYSEGNFFLALRISNYLPGEIDSSVNPPVVQSMASGFELVTPFGVVNAEFDSINDRPIMKKPRSYLAGPLKLSFIMEDVGNSNTHCWNKGCENVFDAQVLVHGNGESQPIAIGYYF